MTKDFTALEAGKDTKRYADESVSDVHENVNRICKVL